MATDYRLRQARNANTWWAEEYAKPSRISSVLVRNR